MGSISMDKDISIAVHVLNIHFSDFGDTAVGYQVVVQHNGSLTLADSDSVLVARTGQLEADIASLVRSSALVTSTTSPDNPLLPVTVQVELCRRSLAVDQE